MKQSPIGQLSLDSLFDSTAMCGFTLDGGAQPAFYDEDESVPSVPAAAQAHIAKNWRLQGQRGLASNWKGRAADNLAAIRLLRLLEEQNRAAMPEEQAVLAKFTGFGATDLAQTMFRRAGEAFRPGWEDLGGALEQVATADEMSGLSRATQYAHYTPTFMVQAIWAALDRMGFAGGQVLEPGCGTGLFFATMPEKAAKNAVLTGIEADPITAKITRQLFPDAWIRQEDFTKARLTERYDLAIGNPPFSDRTVRADDSAGRLGLSLHDYFIARSIERLRPGGIAAFVTSRWTMDKSSSTAREHIAGMADLIGAVRMPQGAMKADAGTEVVVDILFFQRRETDAAPNNVAWQDVVEVRPDIDGEGALFANRYFAEHPDMVLGEHAWTSSAYGPVYTCKPKADADLDHALTESLIAISATARFAAPSPASVRPAASARITVGTAADGAMVKEGSYVMSGDVLQQIIDGVPVPVAIKSASKKEGIFAKHARILRELIPIRDAVRMVLRAQEANEGWGGHQSKLRNIYQSFVRQFGPINLANISTKTDELTGEVTETVRRPNLQPFLDDPDCWLVASIEEYDADTGTAKQGPVFSQRVIHPPAEPVITSAADALAVTLHEVGQVDIARIAELLGRSREETLAELGEAVFLNPVMTIAGQEVWETADAYLSGPVRTKLAIAQAEAVTAARFQRNVAALERVQPEDLRPSDITARLGAPWIPVDVIRLFSTEIIGIETSVRHTAEVASWSIDINAFAGKAAATSEWGTERRHAGELLHDALNAVIPQIYDTWRDSEGEHRELNAKATEAAKEKLAKIKQAFERWVWSDVERTDRLARIYNQQFNNLVPRTFDGMHLRLPGASSVISLRPHQKRVVWRIISAGSTYIAHAVGSGKTYSMAAAIMEQRRLGLISKAMLVVPGHCLAQASREFLQLYPNARILVADETNFVKEKRQRFLARAATGIWDCIVITHSAFKFIPAPAEFEKAMIQSQLESYETLLSGVDDADRITRKRIERMKEGLEAKLEGLAGRKDDMLTIAEIGVDQIVVDEAQEFRKLSFCTNMSGLKGVAPDGSQRAWDLYVKSRFIAQRQNQRALILASGTPITNTLGEMYTLQRFMQPEALAERGMQEFDAWASNFGETRTELELQPSGNYKPITRFAEFVNVADLIAMFRSVADVVLKDDLREFMTLPALRTGKRQIVTAPASAAFKAYQQVLARRIKVIESRKGKVEKGQDILLSVITDGRHAAIDMRFVKPAFDMDADMDANIDLDLEAETASVLDYATENDPGNKLNAMIGNIHRVWVETGDRVYRRPDGTPHSLKGAAQMVFSDLGTEAAENARGFSAYCWVRDELIRLGVPREQIAFMQDYKKAAAKQGLFNDINSGRVRILLGSTQTMGTGVNAQLRLAALHHLDVPWLPSDIEQREGRIERQGNQNEEIDIYAYATLGSVDATSWQLLERKARFISAALAGDRSIRRLEDVEGQANQFAMAKALASGDQRLMQKAGLEAEVARLRRLRAAHFDDQHAIARQIQTAEATIEHATKRVDQIQEDISVRVPTRADAFAMEVGGKPYNERKVAGELLLSRLRLTIKARSDGAWTVGLIGGFDLRAQGRPIGKDDYRFDLWLERTGYEDEIKLTAELTALGLISRLEYALDRFEVDLAEQRRLLAEAAQRLPGYQQRRGEVFGFEDDLISKEDELEKLEAALAATGKEDDAAPEADAA